MVFTCCVPHCFVGYKRRKNPDAPQDNRNSSASIFSFPSDESMRERWIRAIPRLNFNPGINHRVCSEHFSSNDFTTASKDTNSTRSKRSTALKRLRLKPSAVPHIFPKPPNTFSPSNPQPNPSFVHRPRPSSVRPLGKQYKRVEVMNKNIIYKELNVKTERPQVVDLILRHLQTHGTSSQEPVTQMTNPMNGFSGPSSCHEENSKIQKQESDEEGRFQFTFEEMDNNIIVPCIMDSFLNEKLIPVKVANSKICSVYPNAQQNSDAHSELRKPLCTRNIKSGALLEMYNYLLRFHCANEYGSDFTLEISDRFVIFEDFANYYACVRKAFPNVSSEASQRIHDNEVLPIQGGFLSLGKVICPFILRSNVALLPMQVVRVAGYGYTAHTLLKECLSNLKGWLASPRELAYLTDRCQKHHLPLVFGRDTRLVPLPQLRSLFKGKPGFEIFNFPEKDDAGDQQRVTPSTFTGLHRQRQHLFSTNNSTIHHLSSSSTSTSSVMSRAPSSTVVPNMQLLPTAAAQPYQAPITSSSYSRPVTAAAAAAAAAAADPPLMPWNLQQLSNLPPADSDSLHRQQKRRRVDKGPANSSQNSCTTVV